ncbi:MAG TPA: CCC motif membrane protein [Mucilaginibacter sp.]|nr:CCC motif membrane protein [Mucilaginibacter sp.]
MEKETLPNATAVLVLGICSIVFGCFFVGLVLGIIGIVLSGKGRKLYKDNPTHYDGFSSLNAGFIMSIIGTVIGGLYTIYFIIVGGTILSMLSNSHY